MCAPLLLSLLPLLASPTPPQGRVPLPSAIGGPSSPMVVSGAWENASGATEQILLRERADGSLLAYLAGNPGVYLAEGSLVGTTVTLDLQGEDGGGSFDAGLFTGTFTGSLITGTYDDGSGAVPLTLQRSIASLVEEHWLLVEADSDAMAQAARLTNGGVFVGGGFGGLGQCNFLACGGTFDDWGVVGTAHTIQISSGGSCSSSSTLLGTFDGATLFLTGTYTSTSCSGSTSGDFLGGKEGLTTTAHAIGVLELVADLCDALETESSTATDALHSAYLHDGMTRADWDAEFASWFLDYDAIEATATLSRIITVDDGEVHAYLAGPKRLQWHFTVTGVPAAGGAIETLLDYEPAFFQDSLHYLAMESGQRVFVGNNEALPFSMNMPIAAGDGDLVTFGLWPYGVHGGGHPEGHPGIDIEFAPGAPVLATADGTVTYIEHNSNFPTQWDLMLDVRTGVSVQYDHMGAIDPSISVGTVVVEGQILGEASTPFPHSVVHLGLRLGPDTTCPAEYLNAAGQAVFDSMWSTARYVEELIEPLSNNPVDVSFPLTASRSLVSGTLPARMEFTRDDATTDDTTYTLFDSAGTAIESGTANFDPFNAISEIDLTPTSPAGPTRLGVLDIQGEDLWIDWDTTTRPTSLAAASHYRLD